MKLSKTFFAKGKIERKRETERERKKKKNAMKYDPHDPCRTPEYK